MSSRLKSRRLPGAPASKPVLGLVTLLAAGCLEVGPDYVPPEPPLNSGWVSGGTEPVQVEPESDPGAWWSSFGDPTLHRLVDTAYRRNPSLRAAGMRVLEAQAQRGIAFGDLFPQTQEATGAYRETRYSARAANQVPGADRTIDDWQVGLDAAWEIDLWGGFRRAVEAADAGWLAAQATRDDVLVTLVGEVAANYIQLRTLEERLRVAQENVEIQSKGYEIADARYRGGAVTALDASQSASLLADTRALIPALEASIRQSKTNLSILLGLPPSDLASELGGPAPIPRAPERIAVGLPAELLRRRPDVRAAERNLAAQSAQIGVATAYLYPQFSLTGQLGLEAEHVADLGDGAAFEHFGGPSVRWAILNYGRISSNVRVQDARFQALLADYESVVLRAQGEVENAMAGLDGSRRRVADLEQSEAAARRAVQLASLQYQEGAVDFTRVLDSQQALVGVQDRLATSKGDVALAVTALYKALGGGLTEVPIAASGDGEGRGAEQGGPAS